MTLTQTAVLVKRGVVISAIVLLLGSAGLIGYQIWHSYYIAHLPPVEEKPDAKFGLLPFPDFPASSVSTSNFSYSLDTTTGGLPKVGVDSGFEKNIKVYFLTQTFATLLSPDKSQALAEKFDILTPPNILSDTKYQFKDKNKTLLVDLDNGNFSYTKEATISANINPDEDKLVSDFRQLLTSLGMLKDDLRNGRSKAVSLRVDGAKLVPAAIKSETQAVRISLWPAAIDKKSILTANPDKSLINAVVYGPANNLENYLSLSFTYYPIDTSTFATYPLKTTEVAFDDLKNGKGIVIVEPANPKVSITSVSLGYFLPEKYSPYLQPIYIFEGPTFVAFVSAISEQYQSPAR